MAAVVCGREYFKLTSNCHCPKCTERQYAAHFCAPPLAIQSMRPHCAPSTG